MTLILAFSPLFVTSAAAVGEPLQNPVVQTSFESDARDGAPMPIVDEGYWYYGNGRFVTESGREFFWRNGQYENPDGSLMEVPESVNAILVARGSQPIERQPTEADIAGRQLLDGARAIAALSPGAWLHVGQVRRTATSKTGVQADVNIFDRSLGFTEYYMVRFTYYSGNPVAAFQISDYNQNHQWVPNVHFKYQVDPDYYKSYWNEVFSTANGPVWKNVKMVSNVSGRLDVYLNGYNLDYNLYWPHSLSSIRAETQVEIANNSRYTVPHDPANHFAAIRLRESDYSTWLYQTGTISYSLWLKEVATGVHVTPAYTRIDFLAYNYDWMMRP